MRLRGQLGDQRLDLSAAPVRRPGENGLMVLRREMRSQHPQRAQGQGARGQTVQDHGEAPAHARDLDAIAGDVGRHPEGLGAVLEERAVAPRQVEIRPQLEYGEVSHELGCGLAFPAGQGFDARQEILIR